MRAVAWTRQSLVQEPAGFFALLDKRWIGAPENRTGKLGGARDSGMKSG
jgi:hypothetical protein